MLRAYTAVINRDSPLSAIPAAYVLYRKAALSLSIERSQDGVTRIDEFVFRIKNTPHPSFKVMQNIRMVDKSNIDSGVVRIGFSQPELDVVISRTNPTELKVFIDIMEVVQQLTPRRCICNMHYRFPGSRPGSCENCIKKVHRASSSSFPGCSLGTLKLSVTSYPYLTRIKACFCNLINISESLGSLPCLRYLNLSHNRLGESENWEFLTSPFIRENLRYLHLNNNRISRFPDAFLGLKNLIELSLAHNRLREFPDATGNLKKLRCLGICNNQLSVLPSCLYRMERFQRLETYGNPFSTGDRSNNQPQLKPEDFTTIRVPSLFHTVATSIVSKRSPFWEYNIPSNLADYLQSAYRCRCGSIVFPDTVVKVVRCRIPKRLIPCIIRSIDNVPIVIRCCSYKCYSQIAPYVV